ncbi:MAG: glycosyltransferase [Candidatus Sulfotelmatobacter sp.]|jgi:phosphatidyl-myo-inositol dimannoside synthase
MLNRPQNGASARSSPPAPSPDTFLLFAFEYPPVSGGIARLCAGLAEFLNREVGRAKVLTQEGALPLDQSVLPEVRVTSRRPLREWRAFQWLRQKRSKLKDRWPTICGVWYPEGLIAYLAEVRPLIILAHGAELLPPENRWRRSLWKALQRLVLERADLVIANSEYTKQLVSNVAPKANLQTIPLAVDLDHFAPGDRRAAKETFGVVGKHILCTVSRIHRYKAHDTVLRALAALAPHEREEVIYLIAGTGPYETELRRLATELGVESKVRWLGFVSEEDLPQVYRASDLFVLCTRDAPEERAVEGFGLVFLEAQACGTPVVGTRTGGIPAAIRDGEGGWLIEPEDSQKLTEIIRQLVRSPELFRAAGEQARRRVAREGSWKCYGQHFLSALQSVGVSHGYSMTDELASVVNQKKRGVSVVVPTLNRGTFLIDTINDLLAQRHHPLEILVVDQSKTEDPALQKLVRDNPEAISYHKVQFRGLPRARNYGWQQAKHEAVVFVDDDIGCGPTLVAEHLHSLSHSGVGMVAGGIDERNSASLGGKTPGRFNSWSATPVRNFAGAGECLVQHVAGCNFSAWRSVLREAGGFDEALAGGASLYEETELCLRVRKRGFDIYFNGAARVQHLAAGSGGCRISDLPTYMGSLAHNRAILIGRHLRWFQTPVAYLRLILLFFSYARHYRTASIFRAGIDGFLNGAQAAKQPPVCGHYAEVRA